MRIALLLLCLTPLAAVAQQSAFGSCMHADTQGEALNPLRGKIVIAGNNRDIPFSMLTDATKATEAEKDAIAKWAEIYSGCVKNDAGFRSTIPPDAAAIIEATASVTVAMAASLYSGEITYGQFNKERSERSGKVSSALTSIQQRERSRAQAADEADYQARRNAALQYLLGQPPLPAFQPIQPYQIPVKPTVTTNCYRFGNQVTCTSR